jgi:6-phosphofructokinase 1
MNACLRAVVRSGIYYGKEVYGIEHGYEGMINNAITPLDLRFVANILQRGGTVLRTARSHAFMTKEGRERAFDNLQSHGIEGIVAIGGDGTYTGAKIFHEEFNIPILGLPGTIDNDLYGTDYTIGFDTAINTAMEAIDKIRDTADSHDRTFFVEVMGRHAGYIALDCGIAGGAVIALIPETLTTIEELADVITKGWERKKSSQLIVVAEGDDLGNVYEIVDKLKIIMPSLDPRIAVLGHIQRGGTPTAKDRILASRLGIAAVEGLMNGYTCHSAGIINDEIVYVPLSEAIGKLKPIDASLTKLVEILSW